MQSGSDDRQYTPLLKPGWHYLFIIVITFLAFYFDPFGWKTETANLSHDIVQRTAIGPFFYRDKAREFSTVVLFSDNDLDRFKTVYPIPLNVHADNLEAILTAKPKGVFVDFVFYDERVDDGAKELRDTIETYAKENIPLWFARAEGANLIRPIRKELYDPNILKKLQDPNYKPPNLVSVVLPDENGAARTYAPCSRWRLAPKPKNRLQCLCVDKKTLATRPCEEIGDKKEPAWTTAFAMYEELWPNLVFEHLS